MRIGLKYQEIGQGDQGLWPVINNGDWSRDSNLNSSFAVFFSQIQIPGNDFTTLCTFFKYINEGMLICLAKQMAVRASTGSTNSSKSLWVFIPYNILIHPADVSEALHGARTVFGQIEQGEITPLNFKNNMPDIFYKDFNINADASQPKTMNGDRLGMIQLVDGLTFGKIYEYGYQKFYSNFGMIYVTAERVEFPGVALIRPDELRKEITIYPSPIAQGVKIYVDGRLLTDKGLKVLTGPNHITIEQANFEPVQLTHMIVEADNNSQLNLEDKLRNCLFVQKFDLSKLRVLDSEGRRISPEKLMFESSATMDAEQRQKPSFNGNNAVVLVDSGNIANFPLTISVRGYEPSQLTLNLANPKTFQQDLRLAFKAAEIRGTCYDTESNRSVTLGIKCYSPDAVKIVRDGFTFKDGVVKPIRKHWEANAFWALLAAIVVVIALFLFVDLPFGTSDNPQNAKPQTEKGVPHQNIRSNDTNSHSSQGDNADNHFSDNTGADDVYSENNNEFDNNGGDDEDEIDAEADYAEIKSLISYMDNSQKWDRNKMMELSPLGENLWDDVNTLNLHALVSDEYKDLAGSAKYQEIIAISKNVLDKGLTPKTTTGKLNADPAKDPILTISRFFDTLDKTLNPTSSDRDPGSVNDKNNGAPRGRNNR